jgi:hypothetical protein
MTHVGIGTVMARFTRPRRAEFVAMVTVATLLLAGVVSAGLALARDVFSASAFVDTYLRAVETRDVATALSMPGVMPDGLTRQDFIAQPRNVLLTAAAMSPDLEFSIVSEDVVQNLHYVTVSSSAQGGRDIVFSVTPTDSVVGLFPQWRFTTSPLGALDITTNHATFFSVNGFGPIDMAAIGASVSPRDFTAAGSFSVFTPGTYELQISSSALTSEPVTARVGEPGSSSKVNLDAVPTPAFIDRVQREVNDFFDSCVRQRVLLPSGCPFGIGIENRVSGEPVWGVATYPQVALQPGSSGWEIVPTSLTLTFDADIQSLFDGSITTVHEEVPLTISGSVILTASGDVSVLINRVG